MSRTYDFRSDTVTLPSADLLSAITAEGLGDDVMQEDRITQELERYGAELLGFEAGLFVTSGTMGNLLAVLSHCPRGAQFLVGDRAHIVSYEAGGSAMVGGVLPRTFALTDHGVADLKAVERMIKPEDVHYCPTALICIENTFNGYPLDPSYTADVVALAARHGLKVHVDGARLFNAAVALGCSPAEAVKGVDSTTVCLSKGLGAPVGSVLCGSAEFIKKARHLRKALGGGWRQAGVLAAMGLKALRDNPSRLLEDHKLAKVTADKLCLNPALRVDLTHVKTNMVFAHLKKGDPKALAEFLKGRGVLIYGDNPVRLVFHQNVDQAAADQLVEGITAFYAQA